MMGDIRLEEQQHAQRQEESYASFIVLIVEIMIMIPYEETSSE